MSIDEAIECLRTLDAAAAKGWPGGRPKDLLWRCYEAIDVLTAAVEAAPPERQRIVARGFVRRLGVFEPTVALKGRRNP